MDDDSAKPAHSLWVELSTRISTQSLPYRSGDEETAAYSIFSIFAVARKMMSEHPNAVKFQQLALPMLNDVIRPYSARWHSWMTEENKTPDGGKPAIRFRDESVRRKFRRELRQVQHKLLGYLKGFDALRSGLDVDPTRLKKDEDDKE